MSATLLGLPIVETAQPGPAGRLVLGPRTCGPCHACCVALAIVDEQRIAKDAGEPCRYLAPSEHGCCGIYHGRPRLCQEWRCGWKAGLLEADDRPDRAGFMVLIEPWWGARPVRQAAVVLLRKDAEDAALVAALWLEGQGIEARLAFADEPPWTRQRWREHLLEWLVWLHWHAEQGALLERRHAVHRSLR